ncbi:hypothetical protein CFIO01_02435 [Colletotrichum fioriniae PJ7]|uniref:Uncharacterized protein n=1 Tax=Colletotrichum fioriniae PJ7 TaxID=1445577 RepID=A0A010QAA9_9PEZI|nr:hypothetical protein CFIO01_02435 [Colletotrichum fioriniae PJ7]
MPLTSPHLYRPLCPKSWHTQSDLNPPTLGGWSPVTAYSATTPELQLANSTFRDVSQPDIYGLLERIIGRRFIHNDEPFIRPTFSNSPWRYQGPRTLKLSDDSPRLEHHQTT